MVEPTCRSTHSAGALMQRGYFMNRFVHRIVMGALLVATLVLFWHLLGR
jgi:hypothetical protein